MQFIDSDRVEQAVSRELEANATEPLVILVREGMAWAFMRYSADYAGQEAKAKAERLRVHGHACVTPWEWRAQQRARVALALACSSDRRHAKLSSA
jgi:endonuclease YncB( thermonuclease family)